MTHEQFLQWLDKEIEFSKELKNSFQPQSQGYNRACDGIAIFTEVRKKFLTLTTIDIKKQR